MDHRVGPRKTKWAHSVRKFAPCLLAVLMLGSACSGSGEESAEGVGPERTGMGGSTEGEAGGAEPDAGGGTEGGSKSPGDAAEGSGPTGGALPGPPGGSSGTGGGPDGQRDELTIGEVDTYEPDGPMAKPASGPVPAKGRYVYDFGQAGSPSPWWSVIGIVDHTADGYSFEEDSSSAGGGMELSIKLTYAVSSTVQRVKRDHSMERHSCEVTSGTYRQYSLALAVGDKWSYDATCGNERTVGSDEVVGHKVVTVDGTVVQVAEIRRSYEVRKGGSVARYDVVEQVSLEHRLLVRRDETVVHTGGQPSKQWLQLRSLRQL